MNSRNAAFRVLLAIERDGAYSSIAINNSIKENKFDGREASFLSSLVYGVLERKITLDYIIAQYSKIPLKKLDLGTKIILRMGVFQLIFMEKIPESAAVNESVKLAKKNKLFSSSGFINGVLRSVVRSEGRYELPDENDRLRFFSVRYSVPEAIVSLWINAYSEKITEDILKSLSGRPRLTARVNTLKTTPEQLISELEACGVNAERSPAEPNALLLSNTGSVESLKAYKDGKFYIQDLSSQLCVKALSPDAGEGMLDVCSAPGGKAFTAAQYMRDKGRIDACDIYEHKLDLISKTAERLGINCIYPKLRDASMDKSLDRKYHRVLCDVPCSGLGILSRKPEIRYKKDILDNSLPQLQYKILCNNAELVREGGTLVYSTCTLNPVENGENADRFLAEHPDFEPVKIEVGIEHTIPEPENQLTLFPQNGLTDGFFISVFRRKKNDD